MSVKTASGRKVLDPVLERERVRGRERERDITGLIQKLLFPLLLLLLLLVDPRQHRGANGNQVCENTQGGPHLSDCYLIPI